MGMDIMIRLLYYHGSKKHIFAIGLFFMLFNPQTFSVAGVDETGLSSQNDDIYLLLNADHKGGLSEFNVLNIELGHTDRKDIEEIFGKPHNKSEDEYIYQNIKVNGLYGLDKKVEYVPALPLMLVVGFPELPEISVDEHPEAYDDYQYLTIGFNPADKVNRVIYKHFKNVLLAYLGEDDKVTRCYTVEPPLRSVGWEKCSKQKLLGNREL